MDKTDLTDWQRVKAMRDEDIVYDADNPATQPEDWENATVKIGGKVLGRVASSSASSEDTVFVPLSPTVVRAFQKSGKGWQHRINEALNEWLETHTV